MDCSTERDEMITIDDADWISNDSDDSTWMDRFFLCSERIFFKKLDVWNYIMTTITCLPAKQQLCLIS